jgi:hypothetical protein
MTSENSQSGGLACQTRDFPTGEFGVAMANPDNPHFPDVSQSFPERFAKSSMAAQISNPAFDIRKIVFSPTRQVPLRACETMNTSPTQSSLNT